MMSPAPARYHQHQHDPNKPGSVRRGLGVGVRDVIGHEPEVSKHGASLRVTLVGFHSKWGYSKRSENWYTKSNCYYV